ncbi:MAG TPA: hypothetical protein VEM32_05965 [Geobacteraceae bacterium]|nr:hypothetical protein [Geobacteraceae bacterium]
MTTDLVLPMPAESLIPHRPPMRLVDTLLSVADGSGVTEACPAAGCILADARGELDAAALVELIAQSYAAVKGYDDLANGRPVKKGFLVGVRKLRITGRAFTGNRLLTTIRTVGTFEGFAVAEGEIVCAGETIAAGTIKLWIVDEEIAAGGGPL